MATDSIRVDSTTDAPEIVVAQEESARTEEATVAQKPERRFPHGMQKRFDKIYRQAKQAEERAATLEAKLRQYEPEVAVESSPGKPELPNRVFAAQPEEPTAATTHESEVEAPAEQPEPETPEPEARLQESLNVPQEVIAAHKSRVAEAKKRYSDWDALAEQLKASDVDISEVAAEEIARSAHSADVLHFLMERPDVIREISGLAPGQQIEKIREVSNAASQVGVAQEFRDKLVASSSKQEMAEITKAIAAQHPAALIATSLMREVNALPNGPAVFKALLKDDGECQRLSQMSQTSAAIELGRMSARLEGNTPRQVVSSAPPPIKPLGGHGVRPAVDLNDPNLPYADYKKARAAQEKSYRQNGETVYAEYQRPGS